MRTDELEDGKEQIEAVPCAARDLEVPHHHLSNRPHLSLSSRTYLFRRVHEQILIGLIASSFCSPTPALSTTLAAHSAVLVALTMYPNDVEGDFFLRAWQIINEISDQLAHNQKFTSSLLSQTDSVKVRSL
jgi:hypothetical protein